MNKFQELCKSLEAKIQSSYEQGVTLEEAEKLAGEFLIAQIKVSEEVKKASLDTRMRKAGLKAIRAAVWMEAATKTDKKPSDNFLDNLTTAHEVVQKEQDAFDSAEVESESLERYYNIFREAHFYYRGISKGRFDG